MRLTSLKKPMTVTQDEWVASALTDDEMVVELLLRLKHAGTVESEDNPAANLPELRWGIRQRRSRPSRLGVGVGVGVGGYLKKETDSARASPMTPLCWSGGSGSRGSTSPSAVTADGFEDTSRQSSCSTSTRSGSMAVYATNEITSSCSRRRSKKQKKTFLELKDAESFQLKERFDLEKKIANVQATYHERSVKNQKLKRIKLEYSDRVKNIPMSKSNLNESRKRRRLPLSISPVKKEEEQHVSESYRAKSQTKSSEEKSFFFLPDLNMTPTEEDDTLYGTS